MKLTWQPRELTLSEAYELLRAHCQADRPRVDERDEATLGAEEEVAQDVPIAPSRRTVYD